MSSTTGVQEGAPPSTTTTPERAVVGPVVPDAKPPASGPALAGPVASATIPSAPLLPSSPPPGGAAAQPLPAPAPEIDLRAPSLYLNRELSWIEFNTRVLAEAESESVPLLERLKFHTIAASNFDEFFMVRVAGLKQQLTGEVEELPADGMHVGEQLAHISARVHELWEREMTVLGNVLLPRLAEHGFVIVKPADLPPDALLAIDERFHQEIFPILTPISIDPGHPFPHVRNKSLNLGVMFTSAGGLADAAFGVVQVPMMLSRLIEVHGVKRPDGTPAKHAFVLIEDVIARHVGTIFPGVRVKGVYTFRVTRNFDIEFDEEDAEDLLQTIQQELRRRERGNAVRLEVSGEPTPASLAKLTRAMKLDDRDVYRTSAAMLNVGDLMQLVTRDEPHGVRDEPFSPLNVPPLRDADDLFQIIRDGDILLHHPYESFDPIVELVSRAAEDPEVLAIKQTLYRAGGDSPIVKALARAAESGKQVTAIVELKARFDEESNIVWARTLEQSGVHVVYGVLGLKTHAKCLLIVRREKGKLRRYVHLATGNYNPTTSRLYTDVGLLTCRPSICEDASSLFNLLTGYSAPAKWNQLIVAPLGLHEAVLGLVAREAEHARNGRPSRIVAKMNALVDADVIEALYRASQAGVVVTLLIRGICCLRPGVPRVSDNIEVRAIIDRFLEHGRVFSFSNGGKEELYIASADWMPRNFHRRVEVMVPVEDPILRGRLNDIMTVSLADNVKSWTLQSDGSYVRTQPTPGAPLLRSQQHFIDQTRSKVKSAEATARPASRFHMMPTAQKSPLEGKVPRTTRRRRRNEDS